MRMRIRDEPSLDALEPCQRSAAVGIQIDEDVAGGREAACLACDHEAFARLVDHAHLWNRVRHGARRIGTRVVDDKDFVGNAGLGEKGVQAGGQVLRFVMGADNDADLQRHRCACLTSLSPPHPRVRQRSRCRGIPTCIRPNSLRAPRHTQITISERLC